MGMGTPWFEAAPQQNTPTMLFLLLPIPTVNRPWQAGSSAGADKENGEVKDSRGEL